MKEQSPAFTPEGIKTFAAEMENLKAEKEEVHRRNSQADLSFLTKRIERMKQLMEKAIISEGFRNDHLIGQGAVVKLRDTEFGDEFEYMIVNRFEADPLAYKLSEESPMGKALALKKAGDLITVDGPGGSLVFEILAVEYRNQ